jgi:hypothetical protein
MENPYRPKLIEMDAAGQVHESAFAEARKSLSVPLRIRFAVYRADSRLHSRKCARLFFYSSTLNFTGLMNSLSPT